MEKLAQTLTALVITMLMLPLALVTVLASYLTNATVQVDTLVTPALYRFALVSMLLIHFLALVMVRVLHQIRVAV